MDTIKRRIGGKMRTFDIYTQDEADKKGYLYIEWKHADQGDYALSDDGYVGECLSRKVYTDKKGRTKTFIKCAHGVQWVTNNGKFMYEPNKEAGTYSHVKPTRWEDKEARTTRANNAVNAYVADIIQGNKPDWDMIGRVYRPDQKIPAATARRLFKKQRIVDMVEKKLKEILIDKGITQEQVLDLQLEEEIATIASHVKMKYLNILTYYLLKAQKQILNLKDLEQIVHMKIFMCY